ncbi:LytTR family DNA-binding domain-containing protein [Terrimonas sp. NA20]|uniref:LytTR family DNA-binding domain-containing protein n=1 Tax=Terrimonas ginsenosidimutans TaxID=2908004 RepID=A0ABS9KS94_9BACT|nr:LytTR family DNA-binding domain-containing protein [Terrimonas ginsenosidimutans]MCG2615199.1 LytTR family DNA-binding domain-containing protein [Terrimonas ginsenosidimutans]
MNNTIRTIILDDEPDSVRLTRLNIEQHFPQLNIVGAFTSPQKALQEIPSLQPDLLFLDIEMPVINGFDLLEKLMPVEFAVVFVTAYNDFAIKAFRFNALDYLVKPVSIEELREVVAKVEKHHHIQADQLQVLQQQFKKGNITKIAIPSQTGVTFIDLKDIVFVEAKSNYADLVLADKRRILISKTLKDIQFVLEQQQFLRIHRQYIINLNEVKHFNRNESLLTMTTGDVLPVSRLQKDKLIEQYGWL